MISRLLSLSALVALTSPLLLVTTGYGADDTKDTPSQLPKVGDPAPSFRLPSTTGKDISLEQLKGKTVVLYFYPKDETPGCTKEACDFRDRNAQIEKAGVVVLGVSNDDLKSHAHFREKESIPFTLLSDTDAKVSKLYGVYGTRKYGDKEWTGIQRSTFVIGKDGRIAHVWSPVKVDGHADEVLQFVGAQQPAQQQQQY